jgi:MerR family transcriptional regulator, light-induced transcriptional regulator
MYNKTTGVWRQCLSWTNAPEVLPESFEMIPHLEQASVTLSISAVERETGLSKDTLRVWERRYGFPMPDRDQFGERNYSPAQLDKLRIVCRLIDSGHRPGKIVRLAIEHLEALAAQSVKESKLQTNAAPPNEDLVLLLKLCKLHQIDELKKTLFQAVLRIGMERFVIELIAPLTAMVGEAWAQGSLEIFEEHLFTESVQIVLRNAIGTIPSAGDSPRVLLTTFPIESHGLGLLMAEALMALHGAKCTSLGVMTPTREIVNAVKAQDINIVALSFSSFLNPNQVIEGLTELRAQLDPLVEIWAGGMSSILQRRPPPGVRVLSSLQGIATTLDSWRQQHLHLAH